MADAPIAQMPPPTMNILFVNYHDFRSNSAVHIANLAGRLQSMGDSCSIAVPSRPRTVKVLTERDFHAIDFRDAERGRFGFSGRATPRLIHAWTPREGVRVLTSGLAARHAVPYFVHLEDNEDVIAADQLGIDRSQLRSASEERIDARLTQTISHPRRFREFLAGAAGVTLIVDRLRELVPDGIPAAVIPPAFEPDLFVPQRASLELRRRLRLHDDDRVVVYAGNVHPTNAGEVRNLYLAVIELRRRGRRLRLVRLGQDFVDFLGEQAAEAHAIEVKVPFQPRARLASFYALADVLVQPGRPDAFNDLRIPSKLPEFFAMGLPVILPRSNVGLLAEDGRECLALDDGSPADIAEKIERVLDDNALHERLGAGARAFAEKTFSWERSARDLRAFYETILGRS
jgi:glycosyltransferase involved in cell wall biosynthesis